MGYSESDESSKHFDEAVELLERLNELSKSDELLERLDEAVKLCERLGELEKDDELREKIEKTVELREGAEETVRRLKRTHSVLHARRRKKRIRSIINLISLGFLAVFFSLSLILLILVTIIVFREMF